MCVQVWVLQKGGNEIQGAVVVGMGWGQARGPGTGRYNKGCSNVCRSWGSSYRAGDKVVVVVMPVNKGTRCGVCGRQGTNNATRPHMAQ